ncbi:hypothetical protein FISHEDRAFT_72665 [Fistulina hepatica ATCC 64428]|nr:hypothetical protein FISHEDRAFT_72665 [Fistulina hepatica ATCC 64428]
MSHRYTPIPNPASGEDARREMEAAFDGSDDEDNFRPSQDETRPLNPHSTSTPPAQPGAYNFETVDYDYPPPGSPPGPSSSALPNDFGNTNGLVPPESSAIRSSAPRRRPWLSRTAASILPIRISGQLGLVDEPPIGPIGGGTNNDGVFANVTAKPSRPVRVQDGDDTYLVPEDARADAPPSYATAQADAVPPYWETTVHAPFSPDAVGEMIIDSLPTGNVFSFAWNCLVSISFQFVGFLLTYLLHTTHAARLGSRAGLGVTLIQYGFALRSRVEDSNTGQGEVKTWAEWSAQNPPKFPTAIEASKYVNGSHVINPLPPTMTDEEASALVADATTEWLSFFLMTVGWFILLTSVLGFWRVKRYERGIISSQASPDTSAPPSTTRDNAILNQLGQAFVSRGLSRPGFTSFFSRQNGEDEVVWDMRRVEEGNVQDMAEAEQLIAQEQDPERAMRLAEVIANERRLQEQLRQAGLI